MTIRRTGESLSSGDLKAALVRCNSCGKSTLYIMRRLSGDSAELKASLEEARHKFEGVSADIEIRGYNYDDPFPNGDIDGKTIFMSRL